MPVVMFDVTEETDRSKYDFSRLANGTPWKVYPEPDYPGVAHRSFKAACVRYSKRNDVQLRIVPLWAGRKPDREQVGWALQFFWDLTLCDAKPAAFRPPPPGHDGGATEWGPQCRDAPLRA